MEYIDTLVNVFFSDSKLSTLVENSAKSAISEVVTGIKPNWLFLWGDG